MAKKKKNISSKELKWYEDGELPARYYYCVECGHNGDFKKPKLRNLKCEKCSSEYLNPMSKKEYDFIKKIYPKWIKAWIKDHEKGVKKAFGKFMTLKELEEKYLK